MIEARYIYRDARGRPRIKKLRFTGKRFQLKSAIGEPNSKGEWTYAPRVREAQELFWVRALYRLPEVIAALKADEPVWWCEGEKDAESVAAMGVCATTTPNPSDLWDDQARWFAKYRSTSPVVVVCDQDDHGGWWGWTRVDALRRVGVAPSRIEVITPALPWHKDVSDVIGATGSLSGMRRVDLDRLRAAAERYGAERAARYTRLDSDPTHPSTRMAS